MDLKKRIKQVYFGKSFGKFKEEFKEDFFLVIEEIEDKDYYHGFKTLKELNIFKVENGYTDI